MSPTAPPRTTVLVDGRPVGWLTDWRDESTWIDVTSSTPEPDPGWRYTDAAGHEHRWSSVRHGRLVWPGVTIRLPGPVGWCDTCQDWHDGRDLPDIQRWCCLCGERLQPGTRSPTPQQVQGARAATLVVESTDMPDQRLAGQVTVSDGDGATPIGYGEVGNFGSGRDPAVVAFELRITGPPDADS